jgi:hypothetical protein
MISTDWSLTRWGSEAIRQKPRPGGRVTIVFLGLVVACALLELAAGKLWSSAPATSVAVLALQFPAAIGLALGLDRVVTRAKG